MQQPLLSLVLPVHNVAPYLAPCLDSLLAQTLPADQIILVDDGSTDGSGEILQRYAAAHPGIELVSQDNAGVSAARNSGLARARGQFVAFVDPDDFAAPDLFETWIALAQRDNLDIVLGNGYAHYEGRRPDRPIYYEGEAPLGVMAGAEWLERMLRRRKLLHMVWLHLYRREFLVHHGFAFVPDITHEDVLWTTEVLIAAKRVRYDPEPRYFYRQRLRPLPPEAKDRRLERVIDSTLYNARALAAIARAAPTPGLREGLRWQLVDGALSIFHKIEQLSHPRRRRACYGKLRAAGFFPLLWDNAHDFRQRRKIAKHYLKSLLLPGASAAT